MAGRSWTVLLLAAAVALGGCDARSWWGRLLQQQTYTTPVTTAAYGNTLQTALSGNASAIGPILYKVYDAGYFALTAEVNITSGIPSSYAVQTLDLGNGSQVVLAFDAGTQVAQLGFSASDATLNQMLAPVTTLQPVTFLNSLFANAPPSVNPVVYNTFMAAEPQIFNALFTLTQGAAPERLVCSGHSGGGAWAQLCGVWAFNTWPAANVRVVSFGAPLVGDEAWAWTFPQMTDLPYVWVTASDQIPTGPTGSLVQLNQTRVINDNSTVAGTEAKNSLGYYIQTLNNTLRADPSNIPVTVATNFSYSFLPSEAASAYAPPPGSNAGLVGSLTGFVGNVRDSLSAIGSTVGDLVSDVFGHNSPAPAPAPMVSLGSGLSAAPTPGGAPGNPATTGDSSPPSIGSGHTGCDVFLCKIEGPIVDSCDVYNNGNGNIGVGSINIGPSPKYGTDVAVDYNATSNVASIVFRGSSSTVDWVQDFKLWLTEAPTTGYFQEFYPNTVVHEGFLEQFQEVASNTNNSLSIPYQLGQLMPPGNIPTRLNVEGHSLGAGVASLAAVWATLTWPQADVRLVTFGSPKVGNSDWAASCLAAFGRSYRVVNQLDEVPALPPITDYVAIDLALHITNGTVVLSDRQAVAFDDLTWDDHGCTDHYEPGILTASNASVPSWVLALPPNAVTS